MKHTKMTRAVGLVACLGLIAAACGDDDEAAGESTEASASSASTEATEAPATTAAPRPPRRRPRPPQRSRRQRPRPPPPADRRGRVPVEHRDPDRLVARARARRHLQADRPERHRRRQDVRLLGPDPAAVRGRWCRDGRDPRRRSTPCRSRPSRRCSPRRRHRLRLHQHERRHQGLGQPPRHGRGRQDARRGPADGDVGPDAARHPDARGHRRHRCPGRSTSTVSPTSTT